MPEPSLQAMAAGSARVRRCGAADEAALALVGKRLLRAGIEHAAAAGARRLLLGVYARNEQAIGFYRRIGFARVGTRKFNVGGRDYDDHIMGLALAGRPTTDSRSSH